MIRWTVAARAALIALILGASACFPEPDVGAPLAGGCDPVDSNADVAVSFALEVQPLFDRPSTEGGCGCHNAAGAPNGFNMTSYAKLRAGGTSSGASIVVPGDPCASLLPQKLSPAPPSGARMPLTGPPFFATDERQLVHDWIAEGALDN